MPSITVITETGRYVIENDTVANVADLLKEAKAILNLGEGQNVAVNGQPATSATPLADGDTVTTTKPAGKKGL